jgi:hypothetical protein
VLLPGGVVEPARRLGEVTGAVALQLGDLVDVLVADLVLRQVRGAEGDADVLPAPGALATLTDAACTPASSATRASPMPDPS